MKQDLKHNKNLKGSQNKLREIKESNLKTLILKNSKTSKTIM